MQRRGRYRRVQFELESVGVVWHSVWVELVNMTTGMTLIHDAGDDSAIVPSEQGDFFELYGVEQVSR